MEYRIEEIEGIGSVYAARLREAGVDTTADLLQRGSARAGRETLAEITGISPALILKWVNHADLFRIKGVAGQFAELLEAAGVDTVKELRHLVPANLHARLVEVNGARHLCGRVPAEVEIARMVQQAADLQPVVTY